MFCTHCGAKLEDGVRVCPVCHTEVEFFEEANTPVAPVQESVEEPVQQGEENVQSAQDTVEENTQPEQGYTEYTLPTEEENAEDETDTTQDLSSSEGTEQFSQDDNQTAAGTQGFIFCTRCGAQNEEGNQFCVSCGNSLFDSDESTKNQKEMEKKVSSGTVLKILIPVLAVIVLVVLGIFAVGALFNGKSKASNGIVYVKDNDILGTGFSKIKPYTISDHYGEDTDTTYIGVQFSDDGKYIFYPEDIENYGDFELHYRKASNKKGDGEKLDSDVKRFEVLKNNKVVYEKGTDLYITDIKGNKEKIAKSIFEFYVSADETKVLWRNDENDLYITPLKSLEKDKVAGDVYSIYAYSDNFDRIVYGERDDSSDTEILHTVTKNNNAKVSSSVRNVNVVDINGKTGIYYFKDGDSSTSTLYDFIDDDMLEADSKMKEPDMDDYKKTEKVQGFFGWTTTQTYIDDEYYEKLDEYREKESRDSIRESLKKEELDTPMSDLYYYNADKDSSDKIAESVIAASDDIYTFGADCQFYAKLDDDSLKLIKFSDLIKGDYYSAMSNIEEKLAKGSKIYVASKKDTAEVDLDLSDVDIYNCALDTKNGQVYLLTVDSKEDSPTEGDLYTVNYAKNLGKINKYDTSVSSIASVVDGDIYYLKDVDKKDNSGDLYKNKESIDHDVYQYRIIEAGNDGDVYYFKDYDESDFAGKLCKVSKNKSVVIADDVYSFRYYDSKHVALLTDHSAKHNTNDLKLYTGSKKLKNIDTDVTFILY